MSKLKNVRQRMGMSQAQIGKLLGMGFQAVSNIECGQDGRSETNHLIQHLRLIELVYVHERKTGCKLLKYLD